MAMMPHAATSRTIVQQIMSVAYRSVSTLTLRHRLQQSGMYTRHPLRHLSLTSNHRHLRSQWCDKRWTWATKWSNIVFTDKFRFCTQKLDGRIRVWRHLEERLLNCCVMHNHTGPAPGIMVWGGIECHCRTLLIHIAGTLNCQRYIFEVLEPVVLPYIQSLPLAIFQLDNERSHIARNAQEFLFTHQIKLFP
ncbi:transposable element Tcb1 transposase [Trichonephila clavipes]|nr:transposable element Tcb1 transposase [Trichonephila clavipes]